MSTTTELKARIQLKAGTTTDWSNIALSPLKGELIAYIDSNETKIIENSGIILKMNQKIFDEKNEEKIELNVDIVCLNKESRLIRIPKNIKEVLC